MTKHDCDCKLCEDYRALQKVQACDREVQEPFIYELQTQWNSRSPWSHYASFWFLEYRPGDFVKALKTVEPISEEGRLLPQDGTIKILLRWLFFWKFWGKK